MNLREMWLAFLNKEYAQILRCNTSDEAIVKKNFCSDDMLESIGHLRVKWTFESDKEYLAFLSIEARVSQYFEERELLTNFTCDADICELHYHGQKKVLATLTKLPRSSPGAITMGDRAVISYKLPAEPKFSDTIWSLRFIDPLPSSDSDTMLGILTKERSCDKSRENTDILDEPSILSLGGRVRLNVEMWPRHSIFPYVFNAVEHLSKSPHRIPDLDFLLGRDLKMIRELNIYKSLSQ